MVVITGATGNTGSQIANLLLENDQKVRVIGRSGKRLKPFKDKGAEISVGNQGDEVFLTEAFSHAKSAYLLIPPKLNTDNFRTYYNDMGDTAVSAIKKSGIKKIVFLSSLGAELENGTGPVSALHDIEHKLSALTDVDIAILRPGYFMENTMMNIPLIKRSRINGGSSALDTSMAMIATKDIAVKVVELLMCQSFKGHQIFDLFGDYISNREVTDLIGKAINYRDLSYIQFPEQDSIKNMMGMGLSENVARSYIELSHAFDEGKVHATQINGFEPNTPVRFEQFIKEKFRPAYQKA